MSEKPNPINVRFKPYEGIVIDEIEQSYSKKKISIDSDENINFELVENSKEITETIPPYFPNKDLLAVVHYARLLNRPLIIRGEPGCGKTKLAQALAYEIYQGTGENYRDHYFEWNIKSTTKAVDGIYTYDHLARMRAIYELSTAVKNGGKEAKKTKVDKKQFREFGPLGEALLSSTENMPSILLIDEIDKADIDFPNDLLLELDQKRFRIEETGEEFIAKGAPIIIITSNDEKELPNAFLRRCVFHYIEFPDKKLLLQIVDAKVKSIVAEFIEAKLPDVKAISSDFQAEIVVLFQELYNAAKATPSIDKFPSTSELLDWLKVIHYAKLKDPSKFKMDKMPSDKLPFVEVLFKSLDDQKFALRHYLEFVKKIEPVVSNSNEEK